jgi:hypothetical protein
MSREEFEGRDFEEDWVEEELTTRGSFLGFILNTFPYKVIDGTLVGF